MEEQSVYFIIALFAIAIAVSAWLFYRVYMSDLAVGKKKSPTSLPIKNKINPPAAPVNKSKPGALILPPFVKRNRETLKIIAEERPDVILKIVKRWLREGGK